MSRGTPGGTPGGGTPGGGTPGGGTPGGKPQGGGAPGGGGIPDTYHPCLRYFRNPCDRDPPTGNFKNFKFFKNSLKILNVYFWGTNVYFWGTNVYFWGTNVYFWGTNRVFGFFGISFLVAGGFWDSVGRGAPWGFSKISNPCLSGHPKY